MSVKCYHVDAFTNKPFAGNPAAVCILPKPSHRHWMQQVAREMNLSETAFLYQRDDGFDLRWFTPTTEVDLCGHATLASAHVLWESGALRSDESARFHTRGGLLTAVRHGNLIELDFPALHETPAAAPAELTQALGVTPTYVGKFGERYLLQVADEDTVRNLQPDFHALQAQPGRGVVVTSDSPASDYDFVSRYFAPWVGIDEDPVTGSVHCCLGPYWSKRLAKNPLRAYQASARGGVLYIHLKDNRVHLGGHAVTIFSGGLL